MISPIIDKLGINKGGKLVERNTGKAARFEPQQVPGKGWTVVLTIGSRRTGRTSESAGYSDTYTLQQAQVAAQNAQNDVREILMLLHRLVS